MSLYRSITIRRGVRNGRSAVRLRWRAAGAFPQCWQSHWFIGEDDAIAVRDAMRAGVTVDDAMRRLENGEL